MTEAVHAEILSVAPLHQAERLAAIGHVLDAFPEIRPDVMGPRDPPRTRVSSVERQLHEWATAIQPGDYFTQFMARASLPTYGLLWITGDIWNYPPIGPHKLEFGVEDSWFDEPDRAPRLERFTAFVQAVAESMDAFYAITSLTSMRRQTNEFTKRLVLPGVPGTGWDLREHCLPDIGWLNWFGPAFVELWGRDVVERLGIRRHESATGGYLVWATETPFTYDPTALKTTDYAWKLPFYDELGWGAVLQESWQDPGKGVRVPDYHAHRRHVAQRA